MGKQAAASPLTHTRGGALSFPAPAAADAEWDSVYVTSSKTFSRACVAPQNSNYRFPRERPESTNNP